MVLDMTWHYLVDLMLLMCKFALTMQGDIYSNTVFA